MALLLSDLLASLRVKVPLEASTRDEVLRELVDALGPDCAGDREEVLRVVHAREDVLSTGIGHGVALPHGKTDACTGLAIAAGVTREPVEFEALDGEPVRLFFLLVGPESESGPHIKALARISHIVRQPEIRERLMAAPDDAAFLDVLGGVEHE